MALSRGYIMGQILILNLFMKIKKALNNIKQRIACLNNIYDLEWIRQQALK
jgi:hypothetical protein